MIWLQVLWVLTVACFGADLVLRFRDRDRADHAKCIAHVASVTSNRVAANALRDAAGRYDSVEGASDLTRIRNTMYGPASAPVPVLWLREQADKIEADQ